MKMKNMIVSFIVLFAVIFGYEFVTHGCLLSDLYDQTSSLWRSDADMQANWHYMFLAQASFAAAFVYMCCKMGDSKCTPVKCGFTVGLLLAASQMGSYVVMPVPCMLTCAWMLIGFGKGLLCGASVWAVNKLMK